MSTELVNLPPDLREALDQAVAAIVEIAHPELVILFGSWAEGTARPDSDVDLLVVADYDKRSETYGAIYDILRSALGDRDFDLILTPLDRWPRARTIIGMINYEADRYGVKLIDRAA